MSELVFDAAHERDTDRFGAALAAALPNGTTVALCGTLGAGKTRLVQAIAAASGVSRNEVVSPTFVLCQQYYGTRMIYHLDAYRLHDEDEFRELGVDELFNSDAIVIVEWAERVVHALPDDHVQIEIDITGATARRFVVRVIGMKYVQVLTTLAASVSTVS